MVRGSLRVRLLLAFVALLVVVGAGTLIVIERTLADDLLSQLYARLTVQAKAVSVWVARGDHPDQLVKRLSTTTGTRVTVIGADGNVVADSADPDAKGRPIGDAPEVATARAGDVGSAIRALGQGEERQYLVAVPFDDHEVVRLSVPLDDVLDTRARMRNRLLAGGVAGFFGCVLLSFIFIRALTRPLQSMTRAAQRLARGEYDVPTPTTAGGELGVLARAMTNMAGEVKARVGELTQQRDLLQTVLGGLVEGVVVVDKGGAVAFVNDVAFGLVGDAVVHPALRSLVERALAGEPADAELAIENRTCRASARPLSDHGAIVVLYDLTQIRALEGVRREFLSNAAHELRTPVTSISGYAETLLAGGVDAETSKEFLEIIHRNAGRITSLVADLVMLDTLGGRANAVNERASVLLGRVCVDAARTAKGVVPAAQIAVDVPDDLAVLATRDGLDHVVQNLVDNAVKYGGGTPVAVSAVRQGNRRVRLAITDGGPGIPKGHEERVFERFYRLDYGRSRDVGGSGLGLAIVKSQVEAMGGRVWVERAEPGARFVVELDADVDPATPVAVGARKSQPVKIPIT